MRTASLASLLACTALTVAASAAPASAQVQKVVSFNIPAQTVSKAIIDFARQSGLQVVAPTGSLHAVTTPPLVGRYEVRAGLDRLLARTSLRVASYKGSVIVLRMADASQAANARLTQASAGDAQDAPAPAASSTATQPIPAEPDEAGIEAIVVTGSRVISNGNNSPTPVTVVSAETLLQVQPGSIAQALQNLPVFQGSLGQGTGTGGSVGGPNGTANAVNLRNLGLYRTLVLFDGQRVQPTSNTGLVTIDMLPQMLLKRVDVVTGGVSAVYGSDAISGVVNFVTDRDFEGVSLKVQNGISQLGDDHIVDVGAAFGTKLFGGRGHFEASVEYFKDPGIFDMSSRRLGQNWVLTGAGTTASPYHLASNARLGSTSFGGLIRSGPLAGMNFGSDGALSTFNQPQDGGYYYNSSLKGALESKRAFTRFDYDLTDDIHAYVEGFGARNRNTFQNQSLGFNNVTLRSQNPFLPAQYRYGTDSTTFTLSQIPLNIGAHRSYFDLTSAFVNGGLEGKFADGAFKWNVSGSYGSSKQKWTVVNNINYQKLSAALDAVTDPATGNVVCGVTLTNPGRYPGCAPLNLFGPTAASAGALDYVTDTTVSTAYSTLAELQGSLAGSPFSTWAGPVNLALSAEWRRTTAYTTSDVPPGPVSDCAGLRYNCITTGNTPTPNHQVTFGIMPHVHQTVGELAAEADVPLLENIPFARELNLNLAGRYAHYNRTGSAWTWKVGLDWHVSDELRIRATRSRDFRAPNLYDLYAPQTIARQNIVDELTGATLLNQAFSSSGNPDLKPEVANTLTAGFVYKPAWMRGFSLSVDAYDIKITDAITSISGVTASVQRACNASGGTSSLCSLIVRPLPYSDTTAANNATYFYQLPINASSIHSWGTDIEANYDTALAGRPLSLRALVTWQPELSQVTPGLTDIDVSGAAYSPISGVGTTPEWRVTAFLNYAPTDRIKLTLIERWRSSLRWNADRTIIYDIPRIRAFAWTNLNLSFKPDSGSIDSEFYVNVQNLFDAKPPIATNSTANPGVLGAYISTDDYVGRYFTAGFKVKF
jgi:outer membrane receptor protein involved in Fe transport